MGNSTSAQKEDDRKPAQAAIELRPGDYKNENVDEVINDQPPEVTNQQGIMQQHQQKNHSQKELSCMASDISSKRRFKNKQEIQAESQMMMNYGINEFDINSQSSSGSKQRCSKVKSSIQEEEENFKQMCKALKIAGGQQNMIFSAVFSERYFEKNFEIKIVGRIQSLNDLRKQISERFENSKQNIKQQKGDSIDWRYFKICFKPKKSQQDAGSETQLKCLNATDEFKETINTALNDYYLYIPHDRENSWYGDNVSCLYQRIYTHASGHQLDKLNQDINEIANIPNIVISQETIELSNKLKETIRQFEGYDAAFNKEQKTRHLVESLLLFTFRNETKVKMDMEVQLRTFNGVKRPDVVVFERNRGGDDNYIPSIGVNGKMLYIIEAKKYEKLLIRSRSKQSKSLKTLDIESINERSSLYNQIQQNFQQMRNYCIEANISQVFGIMTNFKEWIFTCYSLETEASQIVDENHDDNINPFQMSKVFKIINDEEIDLKELQNLVNIIMLLYSF